MVYVHVPQILVLYLEEAGEIEGELKERNEEKDEFRRGSGKGEEEKVGDKTRKRLSFIINVIFIFLLLRKSSLFVLKDQDIVCAFFYISRRFSNY